MKPFYKYSSHARLGQLHRNEILTYTGSHFRKTLNQIQYI